MSHKHLNIKFKYLTLILCLISISNLSAQYFNVKFKNIGISEGITNNHVTDILQDEYDYIWIATKKGLNRNDGTQIVNILLPEDSTYSPLNNHIIDLEINVDGGLWVLTSERLLIYNKGSFHRF